MLHLTPPREIQLRGYQADAIENLRGFIRRGKRRLLLCAGTGAGKTLTAAHLLQEADRKGSYSLFVVDRVALVDQTSAVFDEYGMRHGIVQGAKERWSPYENIQVCSAQTLARRRLPRDPSLIVVDEAHCQYKTTLDYMARHPTVVKIGLTATPFTKGMGDHWDDVVNVIPTRRLIDEGYLVEPKIYIAVSPDDAELDLNNCGEFSDLSAEAAGVRIVGDVLEEWLAKTKEHFGGPVKTIVFSPTVDHGRQLCAAFCAAGHNFQQISYLDRNDAERAEKISEFRRPDSIITGLVSCGVLTKGFDCPDVKCGISCRPYRKSLSSHIQEIGRVMRPHPGKDKALWLDHSGNVERFGLDMYDVWENGVGNLAKSTKRDSKPRERSDQMRERIKCPECSGALHGSTCVACGWEKPARTDIENVPGEMREFVARREDFAPRTGLRAAVTKNAKATWQAALGYTMRNSRYGEAAARRWANGIFCGIYPENKLPYGWYDMAPPALVPPDHWAFIEREVKRFRKNKRRAA